MKIRILILLATLAGCGGGSVHLTCTFSNSTSNQCIEFDIASSRESDAKQTCATSAGTLGDGMCPTANLLGTCADTGDEGTITIFVYPGGTVTTQDEAAASCAEAGGTFIAG